MFWIWANERSDEYDLSIDAVPLVLEQNDWSFDRGVIRNIPTTRIEIPYKMEPDERLTDNIVAPTSLGLLIHARIKKIFDSQGINNIQYFDSRLLNLANNEVNDEYKIANIIGKVDCIDMGQSELELYDDGEIEFIDKLVLKKSCYEKNHKIFRLATFLPIVIVNDEVKAEIEKHKVTGVIFYRPEDYSL